MAKEACLFGKRGLFIWQKRPAYMANETCLYDTRDLFEWHNRPNEINMQINVCLLLGLP